MINLLMANIEDGEFCKSVPIGIVNEDQNIDRFKIFLNAIYDNTPIDCDYIGLYKESRFKIYKTINTDQESLNKLTAFTIRFEICFDDPDLDNVSKMLLNIYLLDRVNVEEFKKEMKERLEKKKQEEYALQNIKISKIYYTFTEHSLYNLTEGI